SQLGSGLCLSPQRLRGDKAIEVKRLFPREHAVHSPTQLMREHGQRFGEEWRWSRIWSDDYRWFDYVFLQRCVVSSCSLQTRRCSRVVCSSFCERRTPTYDPSCGEREYCTLWRTES